MNADPNDSPPDEVLPEERDQPTRSSATFEAPWQARAFALAVALTDETDLPWETFQSRLVAAVEADSGDRDELSDETVYYRQWLTALEQLLVEEDLLEPGEVAERALAFENGERDAHEFVDGDPHDHANELDDGHAHGRHHDHGHEHHH